MPAAPTGATPKSPHSAIKWVSIRPLVLRPQTKKVANSSQKIAGARRFAQGRERRRSSVPSPCCAAVRGTAPRSPKAAARDRTDGRASGQHEHSMASEQRRQYGRARRASQALGEHRPAAAGTRAARSRCWRSACPRPGRAAGRTSAWPPSRPAPGRSCRCRCRPRRPTAAPAARPRSYERAAATPAAISSRAVT